MSEATSQAAIPVDTQHGDDVDVRSIVVWGLVSVFITVISIFGLHAMYTTFASEQMVEKTYDAEYKSADRDIRVQKEELDKPVRWLNQEGTVVGVPISRAMEITVQEYTSKE